MDNKHVMKLINEAINCLKWDVILNFYAEAANMYDSDKRYSSKESITKELRNVCLFVIQNNMSDFDQEQFIILWKDDSEFGGKLEIMFVPSRSCAYEREVETVPAELDSDKIEHEVMLELLEKSVKAENYELSAVLRDKIKKVKKRIK